MALWRCVLVIILLGLCSANQMAGYTQSLVGSSLQRGPGSNFFVSDVADNEVYSGLWRRDVGHYDTEFQSFFSNSSVGSLEECILGCTSLLYCQFISFTSTTRVCKMYMYLEGSSHVTNTSLWKPFHQCETMENGQMLRFFSSFEANFYQANKICVNLEGNLLILNTVEKLEQFGSAVDQNSELQFVKSLWVGAMNTANGWEWLDGQPMSTTDGSWSPSNPSGNGDCVRYMTNPNHFDDVKCDSNHNFVCEIAHTNCYR